MKVGDLVVQRGREASGVGIATKVWDHRAHLFETAYVTVQWPYGEVDMPSDDLEVISESR